MKRLVHYLSSVCLFSASLCFGRFQIHNENASTPLNGFLRENPIVFAGDSLVEGEGATVSFPERLALDLNIPVVNAGVVGDISSGLRERLADDVLRLRPSVVVIVVGGNDFNLFAETMRTSSRWGLIRDVVKYVSKPKVTMDNYRGIIDQIREYKLGTPIIFGIIRPGGPIVRQYLGDVVGRIFVEEGLGRWWASCLRETVKDRKAIAVSDLLAHHWRHSEHMSGDGIHPNDEGYVYMARQLRPALEKALAEVILSQGLQWVPPFSL